MAFTESAASLKTKASSATYGAQYVLIGSASPEFTTAVSGSAVTMDILRPYFDDVLTDWKNLRVLEIRAQENRLGPEIFPQRWTRDNDPYFFWIISAEQLKKVNGFSYAIDAEPAEKPDLYQPELQYADDMFPEGKHTLYVRVRTVHGVWGLPAGFEIWVDATPPTAFNEEPLSGSLISGEKVAVSCGFSDAYSGLDPEGFSMSINDVVATASFDETTQTYVLDEAVLESGENVVTIKAKDIAGNETTKTWSFVLDNEKPVGSITINNGDATTDNAYVTIKAQATDGVSSVAKMYVAMDGVVDSEFSNPLPYTPILEKIRLAEPGTPGVKTVAVVFEDAAGNRSAVSKAIVVLTLGAPDTKIVSAPETVTHETSAVFAYDSSRPDAVFCYSLDESAYSQWSSSKELDLSDLAVGNHLLKVRSAVDLDGDGSYGEGEVDASPAQWVWAVAADEGAAEKKSGKTLYYKRN